MAADRPAPDEPTEKAELLFALHHRDKPTLAFVECKTNAKRDELTAWLQQELPEYTCYTIDVTPLTVTSLLRTLDEKLPAAIKDAPPVTCLVNVYGLENRLDEQLAAQLNLERELLFRNVPYITLIWVDAYFFRKLQRLAPDLWHWVTYKFRFDDPTGQPVAQLPPLPPEPLAQKGDVEARRGRIHELEERYNHLDLNDSDKLRLLRDKLNTLSLLADEYVEVFEYPKAIKAYRDVLGLEEQLVAAEQVAAEGQERYQRGELMFRLGWVYYKSYLFEEALSAYGQSKELLSEKAHASIYHRVGMVYQGQNEWLLALNSYKQAINLKEHFGRGFAPSSTYHQIGMVYARQHQWAISLENYKQAIELRKQTGDMFEQCNTYHHIGMVYAEQRQWAEALENYEQAIQWRKRTGNTFETGHTYYQIGRVYEEKLEWSMAIENYEQAVSWNQQTGNSFALCMAYYQIGRIQEKQSNFFDALAWFEKSIASMVKVEHPGLLMVEDSIARVQTKLRQRPT